MILLSSFIDEMAYFVYFLVNNLVIIILVYKIAVFIYNSVTLIDKSTLINLFI